MQIKKESAIGKRSRYYQANIDLEALDRGTLYPDLPKSYVIFICLADPFDRGEPIYRFQTYDTEHKLLFGDDTYKIVLNTACSIEKVPEKLRPLYNYIKGVKEFGKNPLVQKIDNCVKKYNSDEWRRKFMTFGQELEIRFREGVEQGIEQGKEQGAENEKIRIAKNLKNDNIPYEVIAKHTGLSLEKIEKL